MLITALLLLAQETNFRAAPPPPPPQESAESTRYVVIYEIGTLLAEPFSAVPQAGEESPVETVPPTAPQQRWTVGIKMAEAETWTPTNPAHPYATAAELLDTLRAFTWPAVDPQAKAFTLKKGYLHARLDKAQHEWVRSFLDRLRNPHKEQVRVDARFVQLPRGGAAKLGLERVATTFSSEEAAAFRAAFEESDYEEMASPSLLAGLAQRASMSILNQVSYVRDWQIQVVQPGDQEIADPVIDVVQEGHLLDLRAVQVGDELYGMELSSTVAQLQRPIPTRTLRIGPGADQEVEVGTPEVVTAGIEAELRLAPGDLVVLYTPSSGEQDLLVLLSMQIVELPPARPPPAPKD